MPPLLEIDNREVCASNSDIPTFEAPDPLTAEVKAAPETKNPPNSGGGNLDDWIDTQWMDAFIPDDAPKKEDEDGRSAYFSKSDFAESNWSHAASYLPPVGIAVVAGGLAICAPMTFLIGAAAAMTTLGTVHAAAVAYESCNDAPCCGLFSRTPEADVDDRPPPLKEGVSQITFTMDEEDPFVALDDLEESESTDHASVRSTHGQDPSAIQRREKALEWVELYYPALKHTARENMQFVGLNALEFFEVFFDNDAPYTLKEYQRKRGDQDIQYGQWEKLDNVQQPSLHARANSCPDLPSLVRERMLDFKVKNISFFGPPYVPAAKCQRALVASKRLLVIESKNSVSGVPLSDRFFVLERWVVTAEKDKSDGLYRCNVSVYNQVFFTKQCAFENQIVSKSEASFKDLAKQWHMMAEKGLKLSEESRMKRIARKQQEAEDLAQHISQDPSEEESEEEGVEIRHLGKYRSRVVGDGEPDLEFTRSPLQRKSSLQRVSRSISKYVRRRSSDLVIRRSFSQS